MCLRQISTSWWGDSSVLLASDLQTRQAWILGLVRTDGDVIYDPVDPDDELPEISVRVKLPGGPLEHLASVKYAEAYRRTGRNLELVESAYGYWSQQGLGTLAFHWHPLPWSQGVSTYHIHCQPSVFARGHFRAHEMHLEEARERFRHLFGSEEPNDCSGLYPF
jgi:hypothetical protein